MPYPGQLCAGGLDHRNCVIGGQGAHDVVGNGFGLQAPGFRHRLFDRGHDTNERLPVVVIKTAGQHLLYCQLHVGWY
jgi:hypothetical protein